MPGPPPIDVDALVAIDVHTHVLRSVDGRGLPAGSPEAAVGETFGSDAALSLPQLADFYRERRMACVAFKVDVLEYDHPASNEEILSLAAEHADVVIPFASVDPRRPDAAAIARRLVEGFDVRGFKFHPTLQQFAPNDRMAYPLYEVIQAAGVPALFHSGQTAVGAGQRGGGGMRLKYSNPMLVDDVAVDFPDLAIVLAHPSVPWQDEALSVAVHKPLVHIDLSGWSPKYFPPQLVQYANTLLREKVLFGTDYPALTPERWLKDFADLPIRDEVRPLILKENAARLLGLRPAVT
jgi:predicted TIM-barrel fold metal-dependent hydrolase